MTHSAEHRLPPPPTGIAIFSTAAWHWITSSIQALYANGQTQTDAIAFLVQALETVMSTIADLTAAVGQLTANESELATEVTALHGSVENLIAAFNAVKGGLSPTDQASLDAAVAGVVSASADVGTQAATLTSTAADVGTANPPAAPA